MVLFAYLFTDSFSVRVYTGHFTPSLFTSTSNSLSATIFSTLMLRGSKNRHTLAQGRSTQTTIFRSLSICALDPDDAKKAGPGRTRSQDFEHRNRLNAITNCLRYDHKSTKEKANVDHERLHIPRNQFGIMPVSDAGFLFNGVQVTVAIIESAFEVNNGNQSMRHADFRIFERLIINGIAPTFSAQLNLVLLKLDKLWIHMVVRRK